MEVDGGAPPRVSSSLVMASIGVGELTAVRPPNREPEVLFKSYRLFRPDAQRARHVNAFVGELIKARAGIVKSTAS